MIGAVVGNSASISMTTLGRQWPCCQNVFASLASRSHRIMNQCSTQPMFINLGNEADEVIIYADHTKCIHYCVESMPGLGQTIFGHDLICLLPLLKSCWMISECSGLSESYSHLKRSIIFVHLEAIFFKSASLFLLSLCIEGITNKLALRIGECNLRC
jgi:hypothetical protein